MPAVSPIGPAPGGRHFLVPRATQLSSLALMSRPTYRLAELELRPATDRLWHLDTHGIRALQIYDEAVGMLDADSDAALHTLLASRRAYACLLAGKLRTALRLTRDPHPFESPDVDPTRPGHYEYAPRQYRVKANVEWALEVSIGAELMRDGAVQPLGGELLFVRAIDGSAQPLRVEGPPVIVASGDPTGEKDAAAEVRLSVRTRGVEPGGEYGGAIELSLVPRSPVD